MFPSLGLRTAASRGKSTAGTALAQALGGSPTAQNDFIDGLNLDGEIDLFGRLRNTATAAGAQLQASAADLAAVELSLRTELATEYFSLRGADTTIQLLESTLATYDRGYQRTGNRYQEGVVAAADVDQAEAAGPKTGIFRRRLELDRPGAHLHARSDPQYPD